MNKNRQSFCRKDSQQETFLKIEKGQLVFACNTCELQRRSTFLCFLQKSAALLNTSSRQFCNPRTMWHDCILQLYFTGSFFGSVGSGNNNSNHPYRLFTLQQNKIIILTCRIFWKTNTTYNNAVVGNKAPLLTWHI